MNKSAYSSVFNPSESVSARIETVSIPNKDETVKIEQVTQDIKTTCPYCGVGCGVLASVNHETGRVSVKGDPDHPANYGKLCSKGSSLAETLGTQRRLATPYYQNKSLSMQAGFLNNQTNPVLDGQSTNQLTNQSDISLMQQALEALATTTQATISTDWDTVLTDIAQRLHTSIAEYGKDSIMFYVSGQLLTEDYYVANKLMKGFIGSNNIDSNSRLCMSSAVAGHKRAFGADIVPGSYTDFETCDLLVLIGSNMSWCHPIVFGRFLKAKQSNPNKKLVVIDPRRTDSCEFADLHLPIAAGTDTHLYQGLLNYLEQNGRRNHDYASQCEGLEEALASASQWDIDSVAKVTQVDAKLIEAFYKLVAQTDKTLSAFSMGVNQSSSGTDKVNAIINTHLLTGRISQPGMGPFSLTGQPNAMGGREVGALSNLLAAHLGLDNPEHRDLVETYWQTKQTINPQVGLKATDVADAILDGKVKVLWIMATNPVVSLPEAEKFRKALAQCDLVIVSECSKDSDTIRCADIVLPAQGWGEKSGTVTNSERRISRQRSLISAYESSKPDWWILSQVAQRMGFEGFNYQHPSDIFNEYTQLTAFKNNLSSKPNDEHDIGNLRNKDADSSTTYSRYLNLRREINSALAISDDLTAYQYDAMPPFQWGGTHIDMMAQNYCHGAPAFVPITPPIQAGQINRFTTTRYKTVNESPIIDNDGVEDSFTQLSASYELKESISLRLITGRLRDQWHTMTRTGLVAKLNQQQSIPQVTLHPLDAYRLGVADQSFVTLQPDYLEFALTNTDEPSYQETVIAQVTISDSMKQGDGFMPMHWSDAFASLARVGALIPTKLDPISGQPELKNSAIIAKPLKVHTVGRILVHLDWLDAVLAHLSEFNKTDDETCDEDASKIQVIWNITKQEDSVLINIATPSQSLSDTWLKSSFWQCFIADIQLKCNNSSNSIDSEAAINESLSHSSMSNPVAKEFRYVVTASSVSQENPMNSNNGGIIESSYNDEQLMFALYIAPSYEQLPNINWLDNCFKDMSAVASTKWLLAGRPASGYIDPGAMVCACMDVGENIIIDTITSNKCSDAVAVGALCQAGTNCGSCVGQINELIKEYA